MRFLLALLVLLAAGMPTRANDSQAETALGGLVLTQSEAISLDSEDLFISRDEVRVKYRFTNTTDRDVQVLVAFPLPDQVYDESSQYYYMDMTTDLGFETVVEGQPVKYELVQQAMVNGKDVTARLAALGWSLSSAKDFETFHPKVMAMPAAERETLLKDGILNNAGTDESPAYIPLWTLRTSITRTQLFPASKTISVEHRYKPLAGGSVGGALNADYRKEEWGKEHTRKHCIEDSWYRAFDKELARRSTEQNQSPYSEWWIGYVLTPGANWKGPIRDFRLVIDKGKPGNLVSFCAEGVKKISPTQFEVRKKDFEPRQDLNVLIVEWHDSAP
ncbi:MAG: DUF4424 domain-containing protein [Rhizobiales bacterium]|nr:DUF4424 domain-containing protein [Hyphomicrobiales bacterium]